MYIELRVKLKEDVTKDNAEGFGEFLKNSLNDLFEAEQDWAEIYAEQICLSSHVTDVTYEVHEK